MATLSKAEKAERFDKMQAAQMRNRAKRQLLIEKAVAQGITVSDAEIDEFLAKRK
jgi:dTDP-4-dehydrorhamnose 3,5-epimerase-like enzyme